MVVVRAFWRKLKAKCLQWERHQANWWELQKGSGIRGTRSLWSQGSEEEKQENGWKPVLEAVRTLDSFLYLCCITASSSPSWQKTGGHKAFLYQIQLRCGWWTILKWMHKVFILNSAPPSRIPFPIQLWECWNQDLYPICSDGGENIGRFISREKLR